MENFDLYAIVSWLSSIGVGLVGQDLGPRGVLSLRSQVRILPSANNSLVLLSRQNRTYMTYVALGDCINLRFTSSFGGFHSGGPARLDFSLSLKNKKSSIDLKY